MIPPDQKNSCPEYRIRLYLSADLVGSTAYKGAVDNNSDTLHPQWVNSFKLFYKLFPEMVQSAFQSSKPDDSHEIETYTGPQIWKTIGDEIIFCVRVRTQRHLACCVSSFIEAMDQFGRKLEADRIPLDIKGAGWLATFPAENISISVGDNNEITTSAQSQDYITEEFEERADKEPHRFDFLGKGIDTGFRISKNATADRFTSSIELAYFLAKAVSAKFFSGRFTYHGKEIFKGVNRNQPYPVISIDTERNDKKRELRPRERILSREPDIEPLALSDYLDAFMRHENIEIPILPIDSTTPLTPDVPSYQNFTAQWAKVKTEVQKRDASLDASEDPQNQDGDNDIQPAVRMFFSTFHRNPTDKAPETEYPSPEIPPQ